MKAAKFVLLGVEDCLFTSDQDGQRATSFPTTIFQRVLQLAEAIAKLLHFIRQPTLVLQHLCETFSTLGKLGLEQPLGLFAEIGFAGSQTLLSVGQLGGMLLITGPQAFNRQQQIVSLLDAAQFTVG